MKKASGLFLTRQQLAARLQKWAGRGRGAGVARVKRGIKMSLYRMKEYIVYTARYLDIHAMLSRFPKFSFQQICLAD